MGYCLITGEWVDADRSYSAQGLLRLSPRLKCLNPFPYTVSEQLREVTLRAPRMSIQGVQPKLSARLNTGTGCFVVVDTGGRFIIKPQNPVYPELPENEALTMHMARVAGIEIPLHGLLNCADGSLSYFVRRFDREGRSRRLAVEDFAQLAGRNRETKYDYSVERAINLLDYCTFPVVERARFFRRFLFNFLVGNEDMHLKNYSIITRNKRVELAPAYDYLSTVTTYRSMGQDVRKIEESALPLMGRKKGITKKILLKYLGGERLGLREQVVSNVLMALLNQRPHWLMLIEQSYLSDDAKRLYQELINERCGRLKS
ncbi:MAG: type II toxin-antitoxin system HipA family toxin [Spartobacteria bacterium]|nr:type II toxin-antitoxin system HipA family toxin [Spartobacteria bacterium]